MALAVVTRIPSLHGGPHRGRARCAPAGIDAEVFDGNFGQVEAPVIEAPRRLPASWRRRSRSAAARDILNALRASPGLGEPDEMGPWAASLGETRRTRDRGMRLIAMILLGAPFLLWVLARLIGGLGPPAITP